MLNRENFLISVPFLVLKIQILTAKNWPPFFRKFSVSSNLLIIIINIKSITSGSDPDPHHKFLKITHRKSKIFYQNSQDLDPLKLVFMLHFSAEEALFRSHEPEWCCRCSCLLAWLLYPTTYKTKLIYAFITNYFKNYKIVSEFLDLDDLTFTNWKYNYFFMLML